MLYLYNGIVIGNINELATNSLKNMDESQKHLVEQKEPDTKDYTLYTNSRPGEINLW